MWCTNNIYRNSAPYTTKEEADRVFEWVKETFEHADLDKKAFHGQIRFSVPIEEKNGGIARLFQQLENSKQDLGFEYYSVAQTTLEDVFLTIVAKHNVEEENYRINKSQSRQWWWKSKPWAKTTKTE